jgi:glyoxylate reductase
VELCAELRSHPVDILCLQVADRIDTAVLDAGLPRLRGICVYAVGNDSIDVAAATERGIAVGNTPGVLTDATADLTMGLVLAATYRIVEGDMVVRAGEARRCAPGHMLEVGLRGSLLGVIGFGRIGQGVARRARAFGMRIGAHDSAGVRASEDMATYVQSFDNLDQLLAESDVVSLHTPLTDDTRHLIDERALRRMKPTAVLVNSSRGAVVDERALVRALKEGWIAGCALDVYEDEPRTAPGLAECWNAVLTPHLGSATVTTRAAMAKLTATNVLAILAGELPPHCVNPETGSVSRWTGLVLE